jgi:hypothetical protein
MMIIVPTGASCGAGKGATLALGAAGATVAHRKAGFLQCVESVPSRLKCVVSRHCLDDGSRPHHTLGGNKAHYLNQPP